jgi:hypothetical protein
MSRILQIALIIACSVVIVCFITGKRSLSDFLHPNESGLPAAPPPLKENVPVLESEDYGKDSGQGCQAFENKLAVVVGSKRSQSERTVGPSWELTTEDDGHRGEFGWGDNPMSNYTSGWLDLILIPGRRVRISGTTCGSGGYLTMTRVEMLSP